MKQFSVSLVCLLAAASLFGCSNQPAQPVQPAVNAYLNAEDLGDIRTVALLELQEEPGHTGVAADLTNDLADSIRQKRLFHLRVVGRNEDVYNLLPVGRGLEPLSLRELADIRSTLGCDAVMIGVVSNFQPYPHMQVGLRLRLIDLRKGRLVWAVDNVWRGGQKSMEERMAQYYEDCLAREYWPLDWRLALVSPKAFEGFVAYETAQTLVIEPAEQDQVKSCIRTLKKVHAAVDYISQDP